MENKNQHFVPRALLRSFGHGEKNRAINMLLKDSGRLVESVSIKGQCSKHNFYGRDPRLESAIKSLEDAFARLRDEALGADPPHLSDGKAEVWKRFILFQSMRTASAVDHAEMSLALMRQGLSRLPNSELEPVPSKGDLVEFAMHAFVENMPMLDDLQVCFLRAEKSGFVISDSPAIHTNRWQMQKIKRTTFGPGHAGTLYFLPISPTICVLLYDGGVYYVDRIGNWRTVSDVDVASINALQFIYAQKAVYFAEWEHRKIVHEQYEQCQSVFRQGLSSTLRVAQLSEELEDFKRFHIVSEDDPVSADELLVHVQVQHPTPASWPSFVRYRAKPRYVDTRSGRGIVRPYTLQWHSGSDWVQ